MYVFSKASLLVGVPEIVILVVCFAEIIFLYLNPIPTHKLVLLYLLFICVAFV